jgi:hypothetical protein
MYAAGPGATLADKAWRGQSTQSICKTRRHTKGWDSVAAASWEMGREQRKPMAGLLSVCARYDETMRLLDAPACKMCTQLGGAATGTEAIMRGLKSGKSDKSDW